MLAPAVARWAAAAPILAGAGILLWRLVPDVTGKPLFEDEAIAGLVGSRPAGEGLLTVMADRGGAPLHFLLAHLALRLDSSPEALRWVSVVASLATLPVTFDLARRLSGRIAGSAAVLVVAASTMLSVYGSFGRMYALLAFVSALSLDLFVRALQKPSWHAALLAAAAGWLLPATHPYGTILLGIEAVVALVAWRGRPFRDGLPAVAVLLSTAPFLWADTHLADRFAVGVGHGAALASPGDAWSQLGRALESFAGGSGVTLAVFATLAAVGWSILARREPYFALLAGLATLVPPLLLMAISSANDSVESRLSPRHLIFLLPIWSVLIGTAVECLLGARARSLAVPAVALLGLIALLSPAGGVADPRLGVFEVDAVDPPTTSQAAPEAVAAPAAWLRRTIRDRDLLFPFSVVFLASLPESGHAIALPRADPGALLRALRRAPGPNGRLFLAVPATPRVLRAKRLQGRLGDRFEVQAFGRWVLVVSNGPFDDRAVLRTIAHVMQAAEESLTPRASDRLRAYLGIGRNVACGATASLAGAAPAPASPCSG